ncbi:hypothetical protein ABZ671_25480 [Micromonospora sp. NPDC006766]|uniref:hypothetical protein n=1 Tax=Micromonospora sp. NPDC006766 TaxID=3154778 RepID=UPI0033C711E8
MPRTTVVTKPISTGIGWAGALVAVFAGLYPGLHGAYWAIPLTIAAVGGAIGIWRAVVLLGMIINHLHWRDVEVPAEHH